MVQRYVRMLENGSVAPPIKVANGIIVEGNHRYVAGRLFGVEPAREAAQFKKFKNSLNRSIAQHKNKRTTQTINAIIYAFPVFTIG